MFGGRNQACQVLVRTSCWSAAFALACSVAAYPANAQQPAWPQHLGPHRNGISTESGLLQAWPAGGLKEVWRVAGGVGMSGLAFSDGRLITMLQDARQQYVVAKDALTGKPQWQTAVAPSYENGMGNGPRATPTIDGDTAFVFTGEGILAALNVANGQIRWSRDLVGELKGEVAEYGMASSPLVAEKHVIVAIGAPDAAVVAVDRETGKVAWRSGNDAAGYSSPALLEAGGKRQVIAFTGNMARGLNPADGRELWQLPYQTNYNCNIATPLSIDGNVFLSAGENHGSVLLRLQPAGMNFETHEIWSSQGAQSVLRNEWQTSILLDGYLYGFDNVGGAGPITHLTCVKAATGERVWQKPRFGKGNMIAADGKLFMSTMAGEAVIARASPQGYDELGRAKILGMTRQAPALAGGLLYLRDDSEILCLDVR